MWVKTISGSLVNLMQPSKVAITNCISNNGDSAVYCYGIGAELHRGSEETCAQVMADIEHGIISGAILVDLGARETHGVRQ